MSIHSEVVSAPEVADAILEYLEGMGHPPWEIGTMALSGALGIGQSSVVRGVRLLKKQERIHIIRMGTGGPHPTKYGPGKAIEHA